MLAVGCVAACSVACVRVKTPQNMSARKHGAPSQMVFLPPRKGKLLLQVPSLPFVGPPLSDVNTTTVSSHSPARFSAAVTLPMASSRHLAMAHTIWRARFPPVRFSNIATYSGGASSGLATKGKQLAVSEWSRTARV